MWRQGECTRMQSWDKQFKGHGVNQGHGLLFPTQNLLTWERFRFDVRFRVTFSFPEHFANLHCFSAYDDSLNLSIFLLGTYVTTRSFSNPGHTNSCVPGTFDLCAMYQGQNLTSKVASNRRHFINVLQLKSIEWRTTTTWGKRSREMIDVLTKKTPWRTQQRS